MENLLFRKAFNGYNKDDVNDYVINISRKISESESAKQEALAKLETVERERDALVSELSALKKNIDSELATLKVAQKANDRADIGKAELEEMKKALEDVTRERDEYKKAVEQGDEKTKQYDALSGKLGEIMITANAQAQELISEAEKRANDRYNEMLEESRMKVGELNEKYSEKIFDKTRELLKRLDEIVTDSALLNAELKVALDEDIEECRKYDGGEKVEQVEQ